MRNFRKLLIWSQGIKLVKQVYLLTKDFPASEIYGLISQMRRASISIPSNIAEGASRKTSPGFTRILEPAPGSSFELETQIVLSKELGYFSQEN